MNQSVDAIVQGPQNTTVVEMGPVLFTCSGTADRYSWDMSKTVNYTTAPFQNESCPDLSGSKLMWTAALEDNQTVVVCITVCDDMPCGRSESATLTVIEGTVLT